MAASDSLKGITFFHLTLTQAISKRRARRVLNTSETVMSIQPITAIPENPLGQPLSIREVALILGCSPWTVRNRHIPAGLPHFRSAASGKFVFYTAEVIRWIKTKQKGGISQ